MPSIPLTNERIDYLLAQANPHMDLSRTDAFALLDEAKACRSRADDRDNLRAALNVVRRSSAWNSLAKETQELIEAALSKSGA